MKRTWNWISVAVAWGGVGAACAAAGPEDQHGAASPPPQAAAPSAPAAVDRAADRYPGINSLAHDRGMWQQLLGDHEKIRRLVVHRQEGELGIVEATTESDDPGVAAMIIDHAKGMQARMKVGAQVRVWDGVFADLFAAYEKVKLEVTPTERGVRIVESSRDPQTIALLRSHALGLSEFVRNAPEAGPEETPRLASGAALPLDEVAIGGVRHRFLLGVPDAEQLKALKAQGVIKVMNFRKPAEHPDYDESKAAQSAGLEYCNLPYAEVAELTDELLDKARAELRRARDTKAIVVLHCKSGARAGAAWAAYRAIDMSVPIEQAIAEAKLMRMGAPSLENAVRDYVRRRTSGEMSGGVEWIGGMHRAVHEGDRAGKVALGELGKRSHLYAIGPVEGLRGEITVIDGERSIAVMGPEGATVGSDDVQAAFLAWSYVPQWSRIAIPEEIHAMSDLQAFILRAAREAGFAVDEPLAYRIEGRARSVDMHIIWHEPGDALGKEQHDKAKRPVRVEDADVSVIGFWSERHRGVFTPMITPFHMHAVTADRRASGHVDDLQLESGARLLLPVRSGTPLR